MVLRLKKKTPPPAATPAVGRHDGKLVVKLDKHGNDTFSWQKEGDKYPSVHVEFEGQHGLAYVYTTSPLSPPRSKANEPRNMATVPKMFILALLKSSELHQRHLRELRK